MENKTEKKKMIKMYLIDVETWNMDTSHRHVIRIYATSEKEAKKILSDLTEFEKYRNWIFYPDTIRRESAKKTNKEWLEQAYRKQHDYIYLCDCDDHRFWWMMQQEGGDEDE